MTVDIWYKSFVNRVKIFPDSYLKKSTYFIPFKWENNKSRFFSKNNFSKFVDIWIINNDINISKKLKNTINSAIFITSVDFSKPKLIFMKSSKNSKKVSSKIFLSLPSSKGIISPMLNPLKIAPKIDKALIIKSLAGWSKIYLDTFKYVLNLFKILPFYNVLIILW